MAMQIAAFEFSNILRFFYFRNELINPLIYEFEEISTELDYGSWIPYEIELVYSFNYQVSSGDVHNSGGENENKVIYLTLYGLSETL